MKKLSYCLALSLPMALIGCGGGGGGGGSDDGGGIVSASVDQCRSINELSGIDKATGRYQGSLTMDGKEYSNAYAFVGPDGKFRLIAGSDTPGQVSYISGQFEEGQALADQDATAYFVNDGDATQESANVTGSFDPKTKITLTSDDSLAIQTEMDYVAPPSGHCMESGDFAATYADTATGTTNPTSLTFDPDGTVTGQTIHNCQVSGSVDSYNVEGGLFFANLKLSVCEQESFDGEYQAIGGFVFDPSGTSRLVDMIIENDKFALYSKLERK